MEGPGTLSEEEITITTADGDKDHVESKVVVDAKRDTETLTLTGTIGQGSGPVVFAYAVRKPSQFAGMLLTQALKDAGVKVSGHADVITDAAAYARLGATCYGFAPVKMPRGLSYTSLYHGHDERIPIDGFAWGLQVLVDLVHDFCRADRSP